MLVRPFQLSDYSHVARIFQDVLSEECLEETMSAFARQLSWDSGLILMGEADGITAGVIIGTIDNQNGYYYRIAVAKEHQGKGLGQLLISALRSRFEQRKVNRILISLDAHNEPVRPLYEKAGYAENQFTTAVSRLSIVNG